MQITKDQYEANQNMATILIATSSPNAEINEKSYGIFSLFFFIRDLLPDLWNRQENFKQRYFLF